MNPPRPVVSNRGTVFPEAVGKPENQVSVRSPPPALADSLFRVPRQILVAGAEAKALLQGTSKKAAEIGKTLS